MTTIVTRTGKGTSLTYAEMDANLTNLNTDKLETSTIGVTVQGYDAQLADVAGLIPTDNGVIIGNGTNFVVESGATLKNSLGLTIGTNVQAYDANTIVVAPSTSGNVLTSNGSTWVSSTPNSRQIQGISATVGSNALTISASPLTLEFRSTTIGSGAITTVSGSPANLVISSGSQLGTNNALPARLIVLALNNAGTIELAVLNNDSSQGFDLSETGFISTSAEGGIGTADGFGPYSTTARTNVAYRVLGHIDITQATAGTWTTAPSTIQGYGGAAQPSRLHQMTAATFGSSVDFTGISPFAQRITITLKDASFAAPGTARLRLGTSAGLVTTGYTGHSTQFTSAPTIGMTSITDGISSIGSADGTTLISGHIVLTNPTGNIWVGSGNYTRVNDAVTSINAISITLPGRLDRISLVATTSTFDTGTISILIET